MIAKARLRDYDTRPFVLLFVLNAVDEFDRSVLAVALDRIGDDFQVSDTMLGLLPLAFIFVAGLLGLPAGTWADNWVRKYIITAGAVVWSLAGFAAAAARSFPQLFASRLFLGAGQGTIAPTHLSLLSDYYPVKVRGRALSYHRSANPFGQILGAVVGGAIITVAGWRWGFVAAAVPGLLLGLYALTLREPARGEADAHESATGDVLAAFLKEPSEKSTFIESLKTIMRMSTLRRLIWANAALGFSLIGVVVWMPTFYERKFGFTTNQAAAVLGSLAVAGFVGSLYGGPLSDRLLVKGFGHMTRFGAITIGTIAVAWPLAFAVPVAGVGIALLVVSTLVASAGVGPITATVAACAPPRIRSQAFAAFGLSLSICGASIAPLLVGAFSDFLQGRGMHEGDSLRWSMFACTLGVMAVGTWFIFRSAESATDDANKTIGAFLTNLQERP